MKKILLFGNCQVGALSAIMAPILVDYTLEVLSCWITNISKEDFTKKINEIDVIITQPINDNYREKDYLNTNYIIKNVKLDTKVIIFPSLHFNFYYFDYSYKIYKNKLVQKPSDYHYYSLIEKYENKEDYTVFINNCIINKDFKSPEYLIDLANKSIDAIIARETKMNEEYSNCNFISVASFIRDNYRKKLLFYSINHPTKHLLEYITNQIFKILEIDFDNNYNNIDPLYYNDRGILYRCIQNVVEFDITMHKPKLNNIENINDICSNYYDTYDTIFDN